MNLQLQYIRNEEILRVFSSPAQPSGTSRTAMASTMKTSGSARTFAGSTDVVLLYRSSYA